MKKKLLDNYVKQSLKVKHDYLDRVVDLANKILLCQKNKGTIYIFGNGGSAAEAEHFATELVIKYEKVRKPIKAFALTASGSLITAHSNDFDFKSIFTRQLEGHVEKKDLVIAMSTSGSSQNVISCLEYLNSKNISNYLLSSAKFKNPNLKKTKKILIKSNKTSYIQEHHLKIIHMICEIIDLYSDKNL